MQSGRTAAEGSVDKDAEVRALLRESGFELEELPHYLRSHSKLIGYAKCFPQALRAQYLGGLLQLFRSYEQLSAHQRGRLLQLFEAQLQEEFARKRLDH
jgi:hypothetical protein